MLGNKIRKIVLLNLFSISLVLTHLVFYSLAATESKYTITVTARSGGKIIAPDGSEIIGPSTGIFVFNENSDAEFKFEPDFSKRLSDVVLDSFSLGPLIENSYALKSIKNNHEIIGVFTDAANVIPESAGDDQMFGAEIPLNMAFKDMISKGISYTKATVSVDSVNGTQNGDAIYFTFFRPMDSIQWQGNLKKYGLKYLERAECTDRKNPEWTIVDKNGDIAVDCSGAFLEGSVSYWSDTSDGGFLDKGGVGQILLDSLIDISPLITVNQYHSIRNINTYLGSSTGYIVNFNRDNINKDTLGVGDDATRDKIINYMYGYSYDADSDGRPVAKRDWVLGDIIHSEPEIIEYFNPSTGDLQYRFIAVGSNDGMLHVFTDSPIFVKGKEYFPGNEVFAFIPADLLTALNSMAGSSAQHPHMVDGSPSLFRADTTDISGYSHKTLLFGERRGGRSYWALDVTNPDPSTWTVKWHIAGGKESLKTPLTQQIDELGFTWNKPFFTEIKISEFQIKNIMIFAGGYDLPREDGFPEAFIDVNNNGAWDAGEAHAATVGGTEGYNIYNPDMDEMGRGIFVVDLDDGSLLFKAVFDEGVEKKTGAAQTYSEMKYCFPADISVIPFSESNLLMYAADIYGQIWKIKYEYYADTIHPYDSDLSSRWNVKRIFTSNPGSDLSPGIGAGLVQPFTDYDSDTPGRDYSDQGRKVFYSPDISFFGNKWTNRPVIYFGTGDRAHPRYTMVSNRFYAVEDTDSLMDETDLLNLTCNELDDDADADNDGDADDETDDAVREDLNSLFANKKVNGFYRIMDEQGNCKDSSTDHKGEHILSQPTLFNSIIYFTSYQPVLDDPSNPTGNVFVYALDHSFGTSRLNYDVDDTDEYDPKILEDTYLKTSDSPISSGVQVITKGGDVSGLINTGGKTVGVAEDRGMDIPGPSGGITQMLWEIEDNL